jgi:hypothetical protein
LESGRAGPVAGQFGPSTREAQLEAEVAELSGARGEAAVVAGVKEVRVEAGMPITRFRALIGVPGRLWRRHQARGRARPVSASARRSGGTR